MRELAYFCPHFMDQPLDFSEAPPVSVSPEMHSRLMDFKPVDKSKECEVIVKPEGLPLGLKLDAHAANGVDGARVTQVLKGGAIHRDQALKPDDYITSINQVSIRQLSNVQVLHLLLTESGKDQSINFSFIPGDDIVKHREELVNEFLTNTLFRVPLAWSHPKQVILQKKAGEVAWGLRYTNVYSLLSPGVSAAALIETAFPLTMPRPIRCMRNLASLGSPVAVTSLLPRNKYFRNYTLWVSDFNMGPVKPFLLEIFPKKLHFVYCIDNELRCNCHENCPSGSDEKNCVTGCRKNRKPSLAVRKNLGDGKVEDRFKAFVDSFPQGVISPPFVEAVNTKTAADRSGKLTVGDMIVEINGQKTVKFGWEEATLAIKDAMSITRFTDSRGNPVQEQQITMLVRSPLFEPALDTTLHQDLIDHANQQPVNEDSDKSYNDDVPYPVSDCEQRDIVSFLDNKAMLSVPPPKLPETDLETDYSIVSCVPTKKA
ncbi:hypothetical protein Ciccas_001433 [Cichlidogyrus casuarinus]|uniref:PDZ domain-containing protein n=1 Tax=Cichlidogyrus casuarinus TaxID=1844966 RepID=A0ABD2QN55_9PLAT